jgi:hypothetical protein
MYYFVIIQQKHWELLQGLVYQLFISCKNKKKSDKSKGELFDGGRLRYRYLVQEGMVRSPKLNGKTGDRRLL